MSNNGPIEPKGDLRAAAAEVRQMYLALVQEDFTPQEALIIIGQIIATGRGGPS